MTKKEKVQIDNILFRLNTILECADADNTLCVDADGAYTHNAMVLRNHIHAIIKDLQVSIENDCLLIKDYVS